MRHADTLVVGAGAAGAVIASRMTERADREVLLLEAGPDHPDPRRLPLDLATGTQNSLTDHDWGYIHKPNADQTLFPLPRGRVVGGSSAVNTCIGLRGMPSDYDEWAALGLPEWRWEKCLPAFIRLETDLDRDDDFHGKTGPIPLRRHPQDELVPWQAAFMEACERVGHPRCDDHNAPTARGYGPHAMNKIGGRRKSAAECYLDAKVRARANLRIEADTLVRRVLFEGTRAVGVEVERFGRVERIGAKRVVLTGGAIATPGILLRSGVGPRRELDRLGVDRVADNPGVGVRLLDHPGSAIFFLPKPGVARTTDPLIQTALRLRGPGSDHENDVQIQAGSCLHHHRFSAPVVILMVQVGKPKGHGTIAWDSADPHAKPRIFSRLLDHPDDRAHALRSLGLALECADTPVMKRLARPIWPPGPISRRKALLDKLLLYVTGSGYHPSGTVPMGPDRDPSAATDQHGRVRGTEGLFVADASLMPTVPTANTHLPTLMIGERFGEWLRDGTIG